MEKKPLTYSEMMKELDALSEKYPFFTRTVIGKSLVGREIPMIAIGHGRKSVLYVGTHHGMEWITTALLLKYLNELGKTASEKGKIFGTDIEEILIHRSIYVVPMLNPDGAELQINGYDEINPLTDRLYKMSGGDFSHWQANGRGVDLNHNYDAGFFEYKEYEREHNISAGATLFSGDHPESEPETSALCAFIRSRDIDLLIALHTQGGEIYYDYGGFVPEKSKAIAKRLEALSGYALSKPEGSGLYGGLKDWFIKEYSRPAFTIECGKGKNPLPLHDLDIIYSVLRSSLLLCPTLI